MAGTARFQYFGWNTLSVIPDAQPERPFSVGNFSFNVTGCRVFKSVTQGFADDAVKLVSNNWVQVSRWTFHYQVERRRILRQLVTQLPPRFGHGIRSCGG